MTASSRRTGWSVDLPDGWTRTDLEDGGFTVRPTGVASGSVGPSVTLEVRRPERPPLLAELRLFHAGELEAGLRDVRLLDAGLGVVSDWEAHRVLLSHRDGVTDVTAEQWAIPHGQRLVLLTISAPTLEFAELALLFHDLADSLDRHA